jgi:hypothetical protein
MNNGSLGGNLELKTQLGEHNYQKQVQRWERTFLEEGAECLMKERRGRA